jgi:hypothetical protein
MQTEAVDCEALSTPLFKIEAKGIKSKFTNVSVSSEGLYD